MSDATSRLIRVQQATLITLQNQRISQLEAALEIAANRIKELERPKPSEQAKREAQA